MTNIPGSEQREQGVEHVTQEEMERLFEEVFAAYRSAGGHSGRVVKIGDKIISGDTFETRDDTFEAGKERGMLIGVSSTNFDKKSDLAFEHTAYLNGDGTTVQRTLKMHSPSGQDVYVTSVEVMNKVAEQLKKITESLNEEKIRQDSETEEAVQKRLQDEKNTAFKAIDNLGM